MEEVKKGHEEFSSEQVEFEAPGRQVGSWT